MAKKQFVDLLLLLILLIVCGGGDEPQVSVDPTATRPWMDCDALARWLAQLYPD